MARSSNNIIMEGSRGAIGKQIVYKEINGKTFISKYPDMSQVKFTKKQVEYQTLFSRAVAYARDILNNPQQKAAYEKKIRDNKRARGTSVYHAALKEYIQLHSKKVSKAAVQQKLLQYQEKFQLNERETKAVQYILEQESITNAIYQRITQVSKATATRDLQLLTRKGLICFSAKGAGAVYTIVPLLDE